MANSKEQMSAEKLCSLIRIRAASTRFKDVFDVYYLLCRVGVDAIAFDRAMRIMVYEAADMREDGSPSMCARRACLVTSGLFGVYAARTTIGLARMLPK